MLHIVVAAAAAVAMVVVEEGRGCVMHTFRYSHGCCHKPTRTENCVLPLRRFLVNSTLSFQLID